MSTSRRIFQVHCPSCLSEFPIDSAKLPEAGVAAICSVCLRVFPVHHPSEEVESGSSATLGIGAAESVAVAGDIGESDDAVVDLLVVHEPVTEPEVPGADAASSVDVEFVPDTIDGPEPLAEVDLTFVVEPEVEVEPESGIESEFGIDPEMGITPELESEPDLGHPFEVEPAPEQGIEPEPETVPDFGLSSEIGFEPEPAAESEVESESEIESDRFVETEFISQQEAEIVPEEDVESEVGLDTGPAIVDPVPSIEDISPDPVLVEEEPKPAFEDLSSFTNEVLSEAETPSSTPVIDRTRPSPEKVERFGRRDPHERARHLARVLVSDIIAYYPVRYQESLARRTLQEDFADEIQKSYREYVDQVGNEMAETTPYFVDALNHVLGRGEKFF